ncbi:hypothetical protein J4216_06455 [Candidatus Woesearchaeota archaeon]|nr:hypothetical protein [Candidatus Woesearchaeota archaeon]
MGNKFEMSIIRGNGIEKLVLQEISEKEKSDKKFIGCAVGLDIGHCVYLGVRRGPENFLDDVKYYSFNEKADGLNDFRVTQPGSIAVEFYMDKPS